MSLAELIIKIKADVSHATKGLAAVDVAVKKADKGYTKSAENIRATSAKVVKSFTMIGAVATTAFGVIGLVMSKQSGEMESYMTTLELLYRSQEEAAEKMTWLLEFAKTTPFELPGLIEATVKLKAYGVEAEDVLRGLGDTASAMGKPINQAVEALADAQTGEFERLKEFGIKGVEITKKNAAALGVSAKDAGLTALTYTDEYGKQRSEVIDRNNREIVTSTLMSIWNEKYAGGMEMQAKTMRGMVSNIKDSLYQASLSIMGFDSAIGAFKPDSLFVKVKTVVENILNSINSIDFSVIESQVKTVVDKITSIINELTPTWENLSSIVESTKGVFLDLFNAVSGGSSDTKALTSAMNSLTSVIADLFRWVDKHPTITKLIAVIIGGAVAFSYILPLIVSVASAIASLILFVGGLITAVTSATSVVGAIGAVIALLGGPIIVAIGLISLLAAAWTFNLFGIRDITRNILDWVKDKFIAFVNLLGPVLATMVNLNIKTFNKIIDLLNYAGADIDHISELQFTKLENKVKETEDVVSDSTDAMEDDIDKSIGGMSKSLDSGTKSFDNFANSADASVGAVQESMNSLKGLSEMQQKFVKGGGFVTGEGEYIGRGHEDWEALRAKDIGPTPELITQAGVAGTTGVIETTHSREILAEQKAVNTNLEILDELKHLSTLETISAKLDKLKLEINNYITNNNYTTKSKRVSGGTSIIADRNDSKDSDNNVAKGFRDYSNIFNF